MTKRFVMIVLLVAAIAVAPICTSESVFSVFGQNQDGGIGGVKGPARTKYEATLEEWRGILKTLQQLRVRYNEANISEVNGIKKEWEDAITRGNELIPQLRDDGLAAFVESPNEDNVLTQLLLKLAEDAMEKNDFDVVANMTSTMLNSGCTVRSLYNLAGISMFCVHEFEVAKVFLTKAQELEEISEMAIGDLKDIDSYIEFWNREQEIRTAEAEADNLPRITFKTTRGDIVIELFENEAPGTVGNMVSLVSSGFYDNLKFHRVLPNFMAQGGCPKGDGTGGPGYEILDECDPATHPSRRIHFAGTLSMANQGTPNTGGSQFFITVRPTSFLNNKHTVFGRVIEGLDVVRALQQIDPEKPDPSVTADRILEAVVTRTGLKPVEEYLPAKVN